MRSAPPDTDALDADWLSDDEQEDAASTRMVDSRELFERAGFQMDEQGAPAGEEDPAEGVSSEGARSEGKITLPPPVPVNEYVSTMMDRQSRSSAEIAAVHGERADDLFGDVPRAAMPWEQPAAADDFESTLDGLLSERQRTQLDFDEPGVSSPALTAPSRGAGRAPTGVAARPLVDDLLQDHVSFGDLDGLDSPPVGARPGRSARMAPRTSGEQGGIDFRLDLGFDSPVDPSDEPAPMTPPPGTLRYGLLDDEAEDDRRAPRDAAPPPGDHGELLFGEAYEGEDQAYEVGDQAYELDRGEGTAYERAPGSGGAAELSAYDGTRDEDASDEHAQMRIRFEAGDYGGALVLAEGLLDSEPGDPVAARYAESCAEMLRQMYKARIGDGAQVLRLAIAPGELRSLHLDHRAGFLLSCIDGSSSIDEILDVSGMRALEALRILYELVQEGIVRCDDPR